MKKILLGLTILSAMSYALGMPATALVPATNPIVDEGTKTTGVQIITRAQVTTSGLIIAAAGTGDTSGTNVGTLTLDHGNIGVANANLTATAAQKEFHIKRANNNERLGRAGYKLKVEVDHDGILKHETYSATTTHDELDKDNKATLNHSLGLTFSGSKNSFSTPTITTTAGKNSVKNDSTVILSNEDYVVKGTINSTITPDQTNALAGYYVNDTLITVTISKN